MITHQDPLQLSSHSNAVKSEFMDKIRRELDPNIKPYKELHSIRNENTLEILLTCRVSKSEMNTAFLAKLDGFAHETKVVEWGMEESSVEDTFLAIIDRFDQE